MGKKIKILEEYSVRLIILCSQVANRDRALKHASGTKRQHDQRYIASFASMYVSTTQLRE